MGSVKSALIEAWLLLYIASCRRSSRRSLKPSQLPPRKRRAAEAASSPAGSSSHLWYPVVSDHLLTDSIIITSVR